MERKESRSPVSALAQLQSKVLVVFILLLCIAVKLPLLGRYSAAHIVCDTIIDIDLAEDQLVVLTHSLTSV